MYERAFKLFGNKKDELRTNGCNDDDVVAFVEHKWLSLRLQKLNVLFVNTLSEELRKLRADAMRDSRRKASAIEKSCVTRAYVFRNGIDGPQPIFRPNAPGS